MLAFFATTSFKQSLLYNNATLYHIFRIEIFLKINLVIFHQIFEDFHRLTTC